MSSQSNAGKYPENVQIALVGAGLVGSLAAIYLAQKGFEVDVFERRPDMRNEEIEAGRSINLNISCRGIEALKRVGIEESIMREVIPMKGRMMHSREGELTYQPYGKDDSEFGNSISRSGLNKLLMSEAEATGKVRFHFNLRAIQADFENNIIVFEHGKTKEKISVQSKLAIGTDGSASAIRNAMSALEDFICDIEPLDYGYKELIIPATASGDFQIEKNVLHIWPRGSYMLIALPNFDGSFTCTLFMPYKGKISFENLKDKAVVEAFFNEHFADLVGLIPNIADVYFANPTGHMDTVRCYPWNVGGRVLIIGDASHGVVPFFGQGMNCGFEDLTVFDQCYAEHLARGARLNTLDAEDDWRVFFEDFGSRRKPNSDSIAQMALENFIEMRDKVADPKFLLAKAVEKVLEKKFPGAYISRYSLVTFSNVPYKTAQEAGIICDEILEDLCFGLQSAEDVDLERAETLIMKKLAPVLQQEPALSSK